MITYSTDVITRAIAQASGISRAPGMEGFQARAYPDPASGGEPWTIGWGSTRMQDFDTGATRPVRPGDEVDAATAEMMLENDLRGSLAIVVAYTVPMLNADQLGALTSFVNNVGPGEKGVKDGFVRLKNGAPSTLLQMVNVRMFGEAAVQFALWDLGAGRVMPGLVRRRALERDVFMGRIDMTRAEIPEGWRP